MTAIPDGRNDYFYSQDFLDKGHKKILKGYDYAIEDMKSWWDNMFVDIDFRHKPNGKISKDEREVRDIRKDMLATMEAFRNEMVTAFIESMDLEDYKKNREAVLKANAAKPEKERKPYYHSTRFCYSGNKDIGPFFGPNDGPAAYYGKTKDNDENKEPEEQDQHPNSENETKE